MSKTKTILVGVGGALGALTLAMVYLAWSAISAKTVATEGDDEGTEGLESVQEKAKELAHKAVYPCAESVKAIVSNRQQIVSWKDEALAFAKRGDRAYAATTPAAFKTFLVEDAKRLLALPGGVLGKIAKSDFAFGPFKDYIAEGRMPAEGQLPVLQRQWDDVATVAELLAASGIEELTDVQLKTAVAPVAAEPGKKPKFKKPSKEKGAGAESKKPAVNTYDFTFTSRAAGFVKAVNALATSERFVVVDDFSIVREKDTIAEALGGGDKKASEGATGRRGRGRGRGAARIAEKVEPTVEEKPAGGGLVTDPMSDAPFKVTMTISLYDFKSREEKQK